ncbi:alpha/beta-hydrolase [Choiromyces venosus 120613-1]|uniref:triacylglycerol lipase n=1 Tax=Choiromyces venosus 120613-1 TaxID=1336337 RepID=A0A3N4JLZ5_9PEZI|nr:alpha/beta-hydrolase [Choiromyces venosus 120613-1]
MMVAFSKSGGSCSDAGRITTKLLLSLLALSPLSPVVATPDPLPPAAAAAAPIQPGDVLGPGPVLGGGETPKGPGAVGGKSDLVFSLRHVLHHGADRYPYQLRRLDIHPDTLVATEDDPQLRPRPRHRLSSGTRPITRLVDRSKETIEDILYAHRAHNPRTFSDDDWTTEIIPMPNITDKTTVLNLARIAANAYIEAEGTEDWLDIGQPYNLTTDFGWEGDGLRGHIFADEANTTVIVGLKGTSPAVFDGAETTTNDKINDNLFFSCCCSRVSYWWKTVCDCFSGTAYTCDSVCLKESILAENRYYRAALNLYTNVTTMYPDANIWLVGHSLGGSVSSLLGQTYGLPVITFEAPGEALAAQRIGLPKPPGDNPRHADGMAVFHFGHTADPIYMGTCNGPTAGCSIAGYALETQCHGGFECVYDVVTDHGWRIGLGYHRIQLVIKDIIEKYDYVPQCIFDDGCVDCLNWIFIDGNKTTTTTSTTSVPTTTSTSTCKTPGWWGCLDERTSTTVATTTSTSTKIKPTTTCTHYGWFGNCLDPKPTPTTTLVTTTETATTTPTITTIITKTATRTSTSTIPTATCTHYGWFGGCLDPSPTSNSTPTVTPTSTSTPSPPPAEKCRKFFFFGCSTPDPTSATGAPPQQTKGAECKRPGVVWGCWDSNGDTELK